MSARLALLADIGGTNARFALADPAAAVPLLADSVRHFAVADFATLADAAVHYLDQAGLHDDVPATAVFALAGRVEGDRARITNSPWEIAASDARAALGVREVRLVNDFAAQAFGATLLGPGDIVSLGGGAMHATPGNRTLAVLGPGTGLGVSTLIERGGVRTALETEGGHVAFAPTTEEEVALLARLSARFGRVSNERVLSGAGLVNLHVALAELYGTDIVPMRPEDITAGARNGDARCARAVRHFCQILGAVAGDLVLTLGAWDGVYLTGGLVPRLLDALAASAFRARFEAKGPFAAAMASVPVHAVVHPHPGLLGAAAIAAAHAGNGGP
jgi:glucokinase